MRKRIPLLALLLAAACGGGSTLVVSPVAAPEFLLPDVNVTSATAGNLVSPRDYIGWASAWYFGRAT